MFGLKLTTALIAFATLAIAVDTDSADSAKRVGPKPVFTKVRSTTKQADELRSSTTKDVQYFEGHPSPF